MMSRDEHLEWAKQRALEYLDEGDTQNAVTSMLSDLNKHPETSNHPGGLIAGGMILVNPGWIKNPVEVRRWIEGFR